MDLKSKLYSSSISFSDLIASGIEDFEDKLFDFICDSKKRVSIDKFKAVSMINPKSCILCNYDLFFENFSFLFKSFVKVELSHVFTIKMFSAKQTAWKSELSYPIGFFSLVGNYLRPSNNSRPLNFNINAVVLIVITCYDLRKW